MAKRWVLPLLAISDIPNFQSTDIAGENHYQITTDTYESVWQWRSYKSSPHHPPHMNITRRSGELADGYVFLTPSNTKGKEGTYELSGTGFIMTTDGDMIFAGEERGYSFCDEWVAGMTDFRRQDWNGRPYITYWNGCNTQGAHWGHRWGRVTFIDEEYTNFTVSPDFNVNTLDPVNKGQIDVHEHQMTDDGTMVVTSYNNTVKDLTRFGGSEETWVAESMFFEFDINSGEVLFQWRAMDHVPLAATRWGLSGNRGTQRVPWDWFHINSVQKVGKFYLISARHHWAVYLINGEDGSIVWKLDGDDGGSFGSIPARFRWQHHVRAENVSQHGMTVTIFNNNYEGGGHTPVSQSQGLAYFVPMPHDPKHPPVVVRKMQTDREMIWSGTQGSYQYDLGNGNGLVGYGNVPLVREYGPGGDLRWQAWFGFDGSAMSYRAFKSEWHGTPRDWDPVAVFEPVRLQTAAPAKVFVSWNGATDISSWAVFAGDNPESLRSVGIVKYLGFETTFTLPKEQCVQLGAIRDGKIIRASNVACLDDDDMPEKQKLEDKIKDLQRQLANIGSGVRLSYSTVAETILFFAGIAFALWAFRSWREKRRRTAYTGVLGTESYYDHQRLSPALDLGIFNFDSIKRKISPRIPSEELNRNDRRWRRATSSGQYHGGMNDESFSLTEDETHEDDEFTASGSRTTFLRQSSGR